MSDSKWHLPSVNEGLRLARVVNGHPTPGDMDKNDPLAYPTMDAYLAVNRALHWRTEQLKQAGIEPADLNKIAASLPMEQGKIGMRFPELPHYPPEDFRFPITEAFPGDDHRQIYHAWRRYPRAIQLSVSLFLMLGMVFGIWFGWALL